MMTVIMMCLLLALRCGVLQEYEDAAEDEYVSEYEDTDGDEDDVEGPALPLHLEQALGEVAPQLRHCNAAAVYECTVRNITAAVQ
jgi:hypothetical protein